MSDIVEQLRNYGHRYCADTWYCCPKHEAYCGNEGPNAECDCDHGLMQEAADEIERLRAACKQVVDECGDLPPDMYTRLEWLAIEACRAAINSAVNGIAMEETDHE